MVVVSQEEPVDNSGSDVWAVQVDCRLSEVRVQVDSVRPLPGVLAATRQQQQEELLSDSSQESRGVSKAHF